MDTQRNWTPIDQCADRWVQTLAKLSPSFATYAGLPSDQTRYDDYSPAGADEYATAVKAVLTELETLEPTDRVDEATKSGMLEELGLALELHESKWALRNLNNIESAPQAIRDVYDLMPAETVDDWQIIAARMNKVSVAVDQYIETLSLGIANGITPSKRQINIVLDQIAANTGGTSFFHDFAATAQDHVPDLPTTLGSDLTEAADSAAEAYERLTAFLRDRELPAGGDVDGVGRDYYELLSQQFVGAKVDLDETYEWGIEELARMAREQEQIAEQIVPGGSVADAVAALDADTAHALHGTEELREWMQQLADTAVVTLGNSHFDIPEPVRRIECMIAPTATGGIYYTAPNDDFSRPGRMWWSVPEGVTTFNTWRETTTVYHEGVPGHHLQLGMSVYLRNSLNSWRRLASGSSGFFEGWALYAERLMDQLGYLKTPADRLGMLDGQRMRAARVVLDIGVHLGKPQLDGRGVWDGDYALEFFRNHVNLDPASVEFEVNRYLGWPGQAPSYKIGQRVWEQERDNYLATRSGATLTDFHREALSLGSLTLDGLKRALRA